MDEQEIIRGIENLGNWFYQFDLKGHLTPVAPPHRIKQQFQRKQYIFEHLNELYGGSLAGKRILDIGCNAGFWSLAAIEHGADFVLGIDARKLHIDQANFVFDTKEINKAKYKFIQGNIFETDIKAYGSFDIVFCLRFLYHISKPISLFEFISSANSDTLVLDTRVSRLPGAYLDIRHDDIELNLNSFDYHMVMYPTKLAVIKMAQQFGYSATMLKSPNNNYRSGTYRTFLCAKQTDLSNIKASTEPISRSSQFVDFSIWVLRFLLRNRFSFWIERKLPQRWSSRVRKIFG